MCLMELPSRYIAFEAAGAADQRPAQDGCAELRSLTVRGGGREFHGCIL